MEDTVGAICENPIDFCEAKLESRHIQTLIKGTFSDSYEEILENLLLDAEVKDQETSAQANLSPLNNNILEYCVRAKKQATSCIEMAKGNVKKSARILQKQGGLA